MMIKQISDNKFDESDLSDKRRILIRKYSKKRFYIFIESIVRSLRIKEFNESNLLVFT